MRKGDPFLKHEALHTASIASDFFDRHVAGHEFVRNDPSLAELADDISAKLGAFLPSHRCEGGGEIVPVPL